MKCARWNSALSTRSTRSTRSTHCSSGSSVTQLRQLRQLVQILQVLQILQLMQLINAANAPPLHSEFVFLVLGLLISHQCGTTPSQCNSQYNPQTPSPQYNSGNQPEMAKFEISAMGGGGGPLFDELSSVGTKNPSSAIATVRCALTSHIVAVSSKAI
jgi:hypothetical protein